MLSNAQRSIVGSFMIEERGISLTQTSSGAIRFEYSSGQSIDPSIQAIINHWNLVHERLPDDQFDDLILDLLRQISVLRLERARDPSNQWLYHRRSLGPAFATRFLEACNCESCCTIAGIFRRAPWITFTGRQSLHIRHPSAKQTSILFSLPLIWRCSMLLFEELLQDELDSRDDAAGSENGSGED